MHSARPYVLVVLAAACAAPFAGSVQAASRLDTRAQTVTTQIRIHLPVLCCLLEELAPRIHSLPDGPRKARLTQVLADSRGWIREMEAGVSLSPEEYEVFKLCFLLMLTRGTLNGIEESLVPTWQL